VRKAVAAGVVTAAHDCSEGGIAVAVAEASVTGPGRVGCEVMVAEQGRADAALFGEGPSRVIVTMAAAQEGAFETLMVECEVPWRWIGRTGGERLVIRRGPTVVVDVEVETLGHAWRSGFERHMA